MLRVPRGVDDGFRGDARGLAQASPNGGPLYLQYGLRAEPQQVVRRVREDYVQRVGQPGGHPAVQEGGLPGVPAPAEEHDRPREAGQGLRRVEGFPLEVVVQTGERWYARPMVTIQLTCRHCSSENIVRNGLTTNGKQRFLCKDCGKRSRENSQPNGYTEEKRQEILRAYHERSSLRGLTRTFGVSRNTVTEWLKKRQPRSPS